MTKQTKEMSSFELLRAAWAACKLNPTTEFDNVVAKSLAAEAVSKMLGQRIANCVFGSPNP